MYQKFKRFVASALVFSVLGSFSLNATFVPFAAAAPLSLASSCSLTPGKVYRAPLITTVFYITSDCQKRPIFNPAVYYSYYSDWSPVIFVEQPQIDAVKDHPLRFMPWGPLRTFQNGSLIKTTDDDRVFLVADGKAYSFGSEEAFKAFGYSFDQVEDVSADGMAKFQKQEQSIMSLDQIPASVVFKYLDTPEVYVLVDESGVLKKWHITTMEELKTRGRADRIAVFPVTKVFENGANSPTVQVSHIPLQYSFNLSEATTTLSGVFKLEVIPVNNAVITSVKYTIGSTVLATVTASPFTFNLNTTSYLDLPNTITVLVTGDDGETKTVTRKIIIKNISSGGGGGGGSSGGGGGGSSGGGSSNPGDTTAPVVTSFALPATSNSLTVSVSSYTASDAVGVTGYLLTETAGTPAASASGWTSSVPTNYAFASIGSRTLYAWAKDSAGNVSLSRNASVTITDTQPPVITSVASSTSLTTATVTWTTDESSTSTVEYGTSLSYGSTSSSSLSVSTHSMNLTGLTANTLYHFRVSSADGYGNRTVSGDRTFRTAIAPDITPPTVSVTTPLTGATVSGTALGIQATASDETALVSVVFKMDGVDISADSSAPYTATLNTGIYANGSHTISAVAIDSSNNRATSTVSVTVNNVGGDASVPTVTAFTLPSTSLSRMVSVSSFTATDDVSVTGYFLSETSNQPAPLDSGWSATPQTAYGFGTDGLKTLYAWAKDATGNVSLSASASVTVDTQAPTVSFTSPTNGSAISGTQTLTASASDAFSIASVSFRIDGSVISLDTTSPYTASLNTASYATGTHTLTAIATDEAGNASVGTVTVTISRAGRLTFSTEYNIGMNVVENNYWTSAAPYSDMARMFCSNTDSTCWDDQSNGSATPINSNGYPTLATESVMWSPYPSGTYTVTWDGAGTISFTELGGGSFTVNSSSGGHSTGTLQYVSGSSIRMQVTPPISNLHIMSPSSEYTAGNMFRTNYLKRLQPFSTLRMMDALKTNSVTIVNWSQRSWPEDYSSAKAAGMPYEEVIALANESGKDIWINIPTFASDDYVCRLARLFRYGEHGDRTNSACDPSAPGNPPSDAEPLNPSLKVYVEFGNEVWNWGFPAAQEIFCQVHGVPDDRFYNPPEYTATCSHTTPGSVIGAAALANNSLPWDAENPWAKSNQYFGVLTRRSATMFKTVFSSNPSAVQNVLAWQAAGSAADILSFLNTAYGDPRQYIDVIASAPYIDNSYDDEANDIWGVERPITGTTQAQQLTSLFSALNTSIATRANPWTASNKAVADTYSIPLVAYEGGQGLFGGTHFDLKLAAQSDPRMYDLTRSALQSWHDNAGANSLFTYYTMSMQDGEFGYWGALLNAETQPGGQKWDALLSLVRAPGDADLDGVVNDTDYAIIQAHLGQTGMWWEQGDFNHDGTVNSTDVALYNDYAITPH